MPRDLLREAPRTRLRLFAPGEAAAGREVESSLQMGIEWVGRIGHPTSYGLLGGYLAEMPLGGTFGPDLDVQVPYEDNLVGYGAVWARELFLSGLPREYRHAVLEEDPSFRVCVAAHGDVSSSPNSFKWLARTLAAALRLGQWPDDESVWALWDSSSPY